MRNAFLLSAAVFAVATVSNSAIASDTLPVTLDSCPLSQTEFNGWFQSNLAAINGVVKAANSITFSPTSNCSFYKWSEHMWLWATSPAPVAYGGGGDRIFTSPTFYDVSAPDPNNNNMRHLLAHTRHGFPVLTASVFRGGPDNLQILTDKQGGFHEIVEAPLAPDGNSLIRDSANQLVEIGRIARKKGKASFYDTSGNRIDATAKLTYDLLPATVTGPLHAYALSQKDAHDKDAKALEATLRNDLIRHLETVPVVERFVAGGIVTFINATNTTNSPNFIVVPTEVTQAGGNGVLITQNHEVTYYGIHVNDVYAYYLTGRKNGLIAPPYVPNIDTGKFPITQANFNAIQAAFPNHTFPDSIALAVELKTSWVPAASLTDPQDYILRSVLVPIYDKTNAFVWTPIGTQTVQLAMVGMHMVGSVAGNPEMVWATYEHVNNSPHARYNFITPTNQHILEPLNNGPNSPPWLFYNNIGTPICPATTSNSPTICNLPQSQLDSNGNIVNLDPNNSTSLPIAPGEIMRIMAFGVDIDQQPDPAATPEISNDQIISLNNHVRGMLPGDVRSNYVFTGATWTINGAFPTGRFIGPNTGNEIGTSVLSNSTLETFQQGQVATVVTGPILNPAPSTCMGCHHNNTTDVSHIFWNTSPLP